MSTCVPMHYEEFEHHVYYKYIFVFKLLLDFRNKLLPLC